MSGLFSSVQFLASNVGNESMRSTNAIKKIVASGDPVKRAALQGKGAGGVSFAANLLNGTASKRSSINAFQNAFTYMQAQADGLRQAEKIYQQMLGLASLAVDPMIGDDERALLSEQFESLRQESLSLGKSSLNGVGLFDEVAASTQYEVTFGSKLADLSGATGIVSEEKDVLYSRGTIEIDLNGGTAGEAYSLWQGGQKIFDTGDNWRTAGSAKNYDYDRFIIEFGPDQETTFQFKPLSPGTSADVLLDDVPGYPGNLADDGKFENKSYYLNQLLGSTTDENGLPPSHSDYKKTSGWDSRDGQKYSSGLGQVTTQRSNSDSTILRLEVDSGSWFQVKGRYIPPTAESSVVGNDKDLQVSLHTTGLGLLRENDDANDFPIINIATLDDAQKAIDSITKEIDGFSQQLGNLSSNMTRVEFSLDVAQKQVATHQKALSGIADEDFAMELLEITKARVSRSQSAALMTQAISINQDIANMLI
jgi:flagellin-like hook-associated protein FlgL